jgi:hypothetical protein
MKKILTILLSLSVVIALAQERKESVKPISHAPGACPSLVMTPCDGTTTTPADLVEAILGTDITSYSNVTYTGLQGAPYASAGLFTGGTNAGIGIEQGIILCSGYISNAIGPNATDYTGTDLGLPGDAQLTAQAGQDTYDANILEFDFVPNFNELFIEFVFGSEEYNEYVGSIYNDAFAFYLNGVNIAHVPSTNTPITINTINAGLNGTYYKNNDYGDLYPGPYPYCNEMDGFTTVIVANDLVNANVTNHIKLAVADGSDHIYDSWVYIKASSFTGVDPEVPISNWALFIGIGLILVFAVIRFRRLV